MKISGTNGAPAPGGGVGTPATDSVSKNIQNQIANAQKQLQDLSADKEMMPEEKAKKRQDIQKTIAELTNQLNQHQMELRKQKQQEATGSSMEELSGKSRQQDSKKSGAPINGLSEASMKNLISADASLDLAAVYESTAGKLEGMARNIQGEIRQDAGRGSVESKISELAEVEKNAKKAAESQMGLLGEANRKANETTSSKEDTVKTDETSDSKQHVSNKAEDKEGKPGEIPKENNSSENSPSKAKSNYTSDGSYADILSGSVAQNVDKFL